MFTMPNSLHVGDVRHAYDLVDPYRHGYWDGLNESRGHLGNRFGWAVVIEDLEVAKGLGSSSWWNDPAYEGLQQFLLFIRLLPAPQPGYSATPLANDPHGWRCEVETNVVAIMLEHKNGSVGSFIRP